ncbi:hypothetical protein ACN9PN_12805 [Klebsiella pasteurii]|uniref:hypothetical protein n=1 Tax=Klebsiella pasteurii TaxID=2587529 RepID=UPI003B20E773
MTDITELAQLRFELSNPAIGSKDHLRKLALSLVEALEKAQTKAIEQGRTACELFDEVTALRQRIAELESRTVTVKLPKLKMLEDYLAEVAIEERKQILVGVKLEFHRALTAAGIKLEAE